MEYLFIGNRIMLYIGAHNGAKWDMHIGKRFR